MLRHKYPSLNLFVLKNLERPAEIRQYTEKCKTYQDNRDKYFFYIHGYWLPWLEQQRRDNRLKQGKYLHRKKKMVFDPISFALTRVVGAGSRRVRVPFLGLCEYTGEMDQEGNATGYGEAYNKINPRMRYSGTWLNNQMHGVCKQMVQVS